MSKALDLAKKLHALAQRGEGGERENAATQLERLCKKHGISFDNLEEEVDSLHVFKLKQKQVKFLLQVACSVRRDFTYRDFWKGEMELRVTAAEAVEISCKFEFYYPAWEQEQERAYVAFLHKHGLVRERGEDELKEDTDPDEVARILKMMNAMEDRQFQKRLAK